MKTLTILAELEPGKEVNFFIDQGMGYFRRSFKKNQDKLFFELLSPKGLFYSGILRQRDHTTPIEHLEIFAISYMHDDSKILESRVILRDNGLGELVCLDLASKMSVKESIKLYDQICDYVTEATGELEKLNILSHKFEIPKFKTVQAYYKNERLNLITDY